MKSIKTMEQEINKIRIEIYEETKNMTLEQRNERLSKIVDDAQREFGFKRIVNAKEKSNF
ncbi:MAG: hypothetical protein FWG49_06630 [Leptospirales bacterium]|nr:hypothetical protein [Leptospirales bacterium]